MSVVASIIAAIEPYAGFVAFCALVVLVVLYIRQARYLKEIKRQSGFEAVASLAQGGEIRVRRLPGGRSNRSVRSPKLVYAIAAAAIVAGLGIGAASLLSGGQGTTDPASSGKQAPAVASSAGKVDPASVTVAMLNGTSTAGLATQAAQVLQSAGFVVGTTTNAAVSDVERSRVLLVAGQRAAAKAVARELGITEIADADSVSKTIAGSADVIVLVGTDRQ